MCSIMLIHPIISSYVNTAPYITRHCTLTCPGEPWRALWLTPPAGPTPTSLSWSSGHGVPLPEGKQLGLWKRLWDASSTCRGPLPGRWSPHEQMEKLRHRGLKQCAQGRGGGVQERETWLPTGCFWGCGARWGTGWRALRCWSHTGVGSNPALPWPVLHACCPDSPPWSLSCPRLVPHSEGSILSIQRGEGAVVRTGKRGTYRLLSLLHLVRVKRTTVASDICACPALFAGSLSPVPVGPLW